MDDKDDKEDDDAGDKDGDDDYEDGRKQLEADMNYFQKVRAQRMEGEKEGVDEVMRQGMNEREHRKEEAVKGFQQQQQLEIEKK